jgi:hypothetical protein
VLLLPPTAPELDVVSVELPALPVEVLSPAGASEESPHPSVSSMANLKQWFRMAAT